MTRQLVPIALGGLTSLALLLGAPTTAEAQRIGRSYTSGSRTSFSGRRSYTSGRRSFRVTSPGRVTGGRRFRSGNRRFRVTTGRPTRVGRTRSGRAVVFRGGRNSTRSRAYRRARRGYNVTRRRHRVLVAPRHLGPRRRTYTLATPYQGPGYGRYPGGTHFYRYVNGRLVVFDGPDHTVPRAIYYDPAYADPSPGIGEVPAQRPRVIPTPAPVVRYQPRKPPVARTRKRPSLGARLSVAIEVMDMKAILRIAQWTKNEPKREKTLRLALFAQFPSPTALRDVTVALEKRRDEPGVASLLRVLRTPGSPEPAPEPTDPQASPDPDAPPPEAAPAKPDDAPKSSD